MADVSKAKELAKKAQQLHKNVRNMSRQLPSLAGEAKAKLIRQILKAKETLSIVTKKLTKEFEKIKKELSKEDLDQMRAVLAMTSISAVASAGTTFQAVRSAISPLQRASAIGTEIMTAPREAMGLPQLFQPMLQPGYITGQADALDAVITNMKLATVGGGDFVKTLSQLAKSTIDVGISSQDSSAAIQALFRGNLAFTEYVNKKSKKELIEFTAILQKFGVGVGTTAGLTNILSKRMGMGAGKTKDFLDELTKTAKRIGVSLPTAMQEFNSGVDRLMLTGVDKLTSRFSKLQGLVKATGISYNDMMSTFGTSTDTFSGSVRISSQLNAVLGTNISAMKLLRNDAEQNVALISKALRSSGKTFDQLGKFEKLMLMQATGIRSASQLKSLMDKSPVELELAQLKGQIGTVRGLREERKLAITRADLEGGMGERMMFNILNKFSNDLKVRFQTLAGILKSDVPQARMKMFEYQVARASTVLQSSLKLQDKLINETLPEKFAKPMTKATNAMDRLAFALLKLAGGPAMKEILKRYGFDKKTGGK